MCSSAERTAFRSALYLTNSLRLARSPSVRPRMPYLTLLNTCAMTAVSPLIVATRNVNCRLHHQLSCHDLQLMVSGNRETLRQFLLDNYKGSTFNTCEHQPLPMMSGPPLKVMIDPEATPFAYHSPIPVPLHWRADVKAGLDRDVLLGVIEPVPVGEPVTWCHRMVVCAKKVGKPRRTVDFQRLNKIATRETHHTQPPFHQARSVPQHTKKSVFDVWNGYHSVALCKEDRALATFITPWGRYRYMTAPRGYIASGDGYTRRFDDIASDVPNKTIQCIDDTIMWSDPITAAFHQAVEWLPLCGNNGITLNPSKFVFAQNNA